MILDFCEIYTLFYKEFKICLSKLHWGAVLLQELRGQCNSLIELHGELGKENVK